MYFAIEEGVITYIGKAQNLRVRWNGHRHAGSLYDFDDLGAMRRIRVAWLLADVGELDAIERSLIRRFQPKLNVTFNDAVKSSHDKARRNSQVKVKKVIGLTIKVPMSIAQNVQRRADVEGQSASDIALSAIDWRIHQTTGPDINEQPRTFTAKIPSEIAAMLDADRAKGINSSEIIVACLRRHYNLPPPVSEEMPVYFKIDIPAARQETLGSAAKLAKISRPEFIRRALAENAKGDTNAK